MELLHRHLQATRNHLQQRWLNDVCRYGLHTFLSWALIIYTIAGILIAFGHLNQGSASEATLQASGILIRSAYRLSVDGEQLLRVVLDVWHSINTSINRVL
jgi:voltage-gated potassium channel Kch